MENKSIFEHGPLRGLIKTVPATSFVSMILLIGGLIILGQALIQFGADSNTRVQILSTVSSLLNTVAVFYFASKLNTPKDS